ncbi:DUF2512 family protein [Aneurinibacillus thermoaerophilus]|uniref:DUF2512 family protein n=1 Tax=Aneurinibacillus thermoaerophilus TaxID=143495 RepID=A0A1G8D9Y7_ANETH|nr:MULTISPECIES: DUF2512 family protein [Aneurinibacillus]AMA72013.1 hypothetical protein ACH33_03590 [Aneurinibacillus sp. XH2]MED0677025.1 DUF2512 family protein [Aneurinibacillus thermoaerophilus]MED0679295.1 DUF2512 family protein [Aneurinibacillus thermoaerophilus]MED0757227.1 DUF2512 family protein [Aneurinibacillus thermoaerophilus]MED0762449.1 DUF2512 family protein [Aneurinibacillus thermoaerophilus]
MAKRVFFNFLYKVVLFPGVLYLLSVTFPSQLMFENINHWLDVSLLLLVIGLIADEVVLGIYGIYKATLQGTLAIAVIVYLSGWLFPQSKITLLGGVIAGISLGTVELIMHRYIRVNQKKHKRKNS